MKLNYIWLIVFLAVFTACEDDEATQGAEQLPALDTKDLDFSKYVSVGASFTAGFTDGALFIAGQENSFPNILAQRFANENDKTFAQPLMNDNIGGVVANGVAIQLPRLYFFNDADPTDDYDSGPYRLGITPPTSFKMATPTTTLANLGKTFNNMGVPGAKSIHLLYDGLGNPQNLATQTANPYFVRMASSSTATVLGDVMTQTPTFFTLSEIGGNDVLGYAISGGDGSNPITPVSGPPGVGFNETYTTILNTLTSGGAKGVIATVPYVTNLPFFTTVSNNALELDATSAAQLTSVFKAVSGLFIASLKAKGVPENTANALGAQYAIEFKEGKNRWIIDVPVTDTNPLGFRQMTEDELVLLTIDRAALKAGYGSVVLTPEVMQVLGLLQQNGIPTPKQAALVLNAVSGIDDKDVLDTDELTAINTATDAYNTTIRSLATSNDAVALVELDKILKQAYKSGIAFDNYTMTTELVFGGLISLDGIHLTSRGYALMANEFLKAIDAKFNTNFIEAGLSAKADNYTTTYAESLR